MTLQKGLNTFTVVGIGHDSVNRALLESQFKDVKQHQLVDIRHHHFACLEAVTKAIAARALDVLLFVCLFVLFSGKYSFPQASLHANLGQTQISLFTARIGVPLLRSAVSVSQRLRFSAKAQM